MAAREQRAMIEAYGRATTQMRVDLLTSLLALFRGLGSWRDSDQGRFIAAAVPRLLGSQRQMASVTEAFLTRMASDMLGRPARAPGIQPQTGTQLRGVDPEVVYARPFKTMYATLGDGRDFPTAMEYATRRLVHLVTTDLQLAKTHAAHDTLAEQDGVQYYQRVLTGTVSCGLCIVASTQRYHKGDLLPIHPGCDCSVTPIVGTQDPGQVINQDRLEDVHDAIQQAFGVSDRGGRNPIDYRDVLVEHVHGEIGPVLGKRGDNFTGPDDVRSS